MQGSWHVTRVLHALEALTLELSGRSPSSSGTALGAFSCKIKIRVASRHEAVRDTLLFLGFSYSGPDQGVFLSRPPGCISVLAGPSDCRSKLSRFTQWNCRVSLMFIGKSFFFFMAHLATVVVPQGLHLPQGAAQGPRKRRILLGGIVGIPRALLGGIVGIPPSGQTWGALRQGL